MICCADSTILENCTQAFDDSGLQFAEGSHRDVALHYLHPGRRDSLEGRGYRIASVGASLPLLISGVAEGCEHNSNLTLTCAPPCPGMLYS